MLLQFVDTYLGKQVHLYRRLRSGHGGKVAFKDLWMLYDTGDTIYCPFREGDQKIPSYNNDANKTQRRDVPQAYRVVATTGGIPLRKTFDPRAQVSDAELGTDTGLATGHAAMQDNQFSGSSRGGVGLPSLRRTKDKYSPLHVMCFYVDFDGLKYVTVSDVFVFRPYDGEMDIRSLEAYPMQYFGRLPALMLSGQNEAEEDAKLTEMLLQRGREFMKVTNVSHMFHEGLTVGKNREVVSGLQKNDR
jgi:hypothetical protein